ncbi:hypothetical protein BRARA_E02506 [Brassica rapa]|uniref:Uncharacterized protein n=1 Tax=Brassica campestris TaxID=3711 RepID=A0A397ZDC0_BRACM|nr:hypothetical protein BRARA_E02506 [Brassica rapa]
MLGNPPAYITPMRKQHSEALTASEESQYQDTKAIPHDKLLTPHLRRRTVQARSKDLPPEHREELASYHHAP